MPPEQQRIAIAQACGWGRCHLIGKSIVWGYRPNAGRYSCVPDYLNDLNAMHEAEKVLRKSQLTDFAEWLGYDNTEFAEKNVERLLRATAAQRAEAFLRTLNLWKD